MRWPARQAADSTKGGGRRRGQAMRGGDPVRPCVAGQPLTQTARPTGAAPRACPGRGVEPPTVTAHVNCDGPRLPPARGSLSPLARPRGRPLTALALANTAGSGQVHPVHPRWTVPVHPRPQPVTLSLAGARGRLTLRLCSLPTRAPSHTRGAPWAGGSGGLLDRSRQEPRCRVQ